jgi:hypothetical protein
MKDGNSCENEENAAEHIDVSKKTRIDHVSRPMAFPIPDHLPRRAEPQDVSSKILSRIDEATNATLNAALARSWLDELDDTIQATKVFCSVQMLSFADF